MIHDIEEAENKLSIILEESQKSWQGAASIIIAVEQLELWRHRDCHSFTSWLEGLAKKFGVSMPWIWQAYRAGKVLSKIHNRKYPENCHSFDKIAKLYPSDLSPSALTLVDKIEDAKAPAKLVEKIQDQVIKNEANTTSLQNVFNEYDLGRKIGRKNNDLVASIHQINFANIIHGVDSGKIFVEKRKPLRQTVYTKIPADSYLDALIVVPAPPQNDAIFIGVLTKNKLKIISENIMKFCDYIFLLRHILDKDKADLDFPLSGTLIIDPLNANFKVKGLEINNRVSDLKKGKLSLYMHNRALQGKHILINPIFDQE